MYRVSSFVPRFARALLAGAVLATVWINLDPASYYDSIEWHLLDLAPPDLERPGWTPALPASLTLRALIGDGLMALFFFFIGKELWEAVVLERGALHGQRALLPLILILGGLAGAAGVWMLTAALIETAEEAAFATGWQVPLGSDVLVCYLVGRRVFGPGQPALHFLMLLAIGTDLAALAILGLGQPLADLRPLWLLLPAVAAATAWIGFGRPVASDAPERDRQARQALWPYLLAGLASWLGVAASGLPAALGLLPLIPAIARTDHSFGLFAEVEELLHDPLNRLVHALAWPLTVILFLFGMTHGAIDLQAYAPTTLVTLLALWVGRPLGLLTLGLGLAAALGLRMPPGIGLRDVVLAALILAMGFTVPALALERALPGGVMQEAARLGLAVSLLVGPIVLLLAKRRPHRSAPPAGQADRTSE